MISVADMQAMLTSMVQGYAKQGIPPWLIDPSGLKEELASRLQAEHGVPVDARQMIVRVFHELNSGVTSIYAAPMRRK